jgi:DNA-binding beta-propeller fold protein YncE
VDDRHFDDFSRRVGALTAPRLPRRGLLRLLGGGALAAALGLTSLELELAEAKKMKNKNKKKNKNKNKKCKQPGKKCDKKKCKKENKKCCCEGKCKNNRCEGLCPLKVSFSNQWGGFNAPWGIATAPDGDVYVTDSGNQRVKIFNQNGDFIDEFGEPGTGSDQFQEPRGIGVNENNNGNERVYVTDPLQSTDRKFRRFDAFGDNPTDRGVSGLTDPFGVGIDANNHIWVVDNVDDGEVFLFDRNSGDFVTSWVFGGDDGLNNPQGIAVFKENDKTFVFVTDTGNNRVVKFEYLNNGSDGLQFRQAAGSGGDGNDRFDQPVGIAADECGNIWVADRLNNRIQQLDKNLAFKSRFTSGFNRPTGVALSPNGNSLYVVDSLNDQVQKFNLT